MEKIKQVSARQIVVPVDVPLRVGGYSIYQRDYCLVEITTDSGRVGIALAFSRGSDLASAVAEIVAPHLIGQDPEQIESLWSAIYLKTRLLGRQGLIMRALSLTDIALWDLKAKTAGFPLARLLGGFRTSVPVLMAGGYYAEDKGERELIEEYQGYLREGYRHLKLMVGGETPEVDLKRYIAVRKSIPAEFSLGVDVNGSWKSPKAALQWIERAQQATGLPINFIEEPLPPEQFNGTQFIRERTNVPLAIGEFLAGRWEFRRWIEGGAVDMVRADSTLCGGITEWKRISALADSFDLPLIPHYFPSIHIHLSLAFPGCEQVEVVSELGNNSSEYLLTGRSYQITNGTAHLFGEPGLGLAVEAAAVARFTVSHRSVAK